MVKESLPNSILSTAQEKLFQLLLNFQESLKRIHWKKIQTETEYQKLILILWKHIPEVYRGFDGVVDETIQNLNTPVFCKKGCSTCCNHYVSSVEPFEMMYIDSIVRNSQHYPKLLHSLYDRSLEMQSSLEKCKQDEDKALYHYFLQKKMCPFIGSEGQCKIHLYRAMSCRMFLSLSPPKYCAGSLTTHRLNKNFHVELEDSLEVLITTISYSFRKLELGDNLFPGLLKVNELFGGFNLPKPCPDNY